jgi:hypothetical protein
LRRLTWRGLDERLDSIVVNDEREPIARVEQANGVGNGRARHLDLLSVHRAGAVEHQHHADRVPVLRRSLR